VAKGKHPQSRAERRKAYYAHGDPERKWHERVVPNKKRKAQAHWDDYEFFKDLGMAPKE
jgi:hypothetical protein